MVWVLAPVRMSSAAAGVGMTDPVVEEALRLLWSFAWYWEQSWLWWPCLLLLER